jgi:hypothetical protein
MNPPAEQLIRDYLNRVSVAARGRLGSAERREFLARMRESIERRSGSPDNADLAEVRKLLSGLGEPAALVDMERARLAALRGETGPAGPGSGHLTGRPAAWMSRRAWRGAAVAVPPEPADSLPLTGEVSSSVQNRPVTARRRPGQPMQARPSGPQRPRWTRNGAERQGMPGTTVRPPDANGAGPVVPDGKTADRKARRNGVPVARPGRAVPADLSAGSPGTAFDDGTVFGGPVSGGSAADGSAADGSAGGPVSGGPVADGSPGGSRRWPPRTGAQPEQPDPATGFLAGLLAAGPRDDSTRSAGGTRLADGSARLEDVGASIGGLGRAALALARRCPLEASAIAAMGLGGLVYPPVWLLGAAVALLSKHWDFRDKWIGLAGPVLLVIAGTGISVALGGNRTSFGAYLHAAWMAADYLSRAAAVLGAVYLTRCVQRGRRQPPVPPWNRPHRL